MDAGCVGRAWLEGALWHLEPNSLLLLQGFLLGWELPLNFGILDLKETDDWI